MKLSNIGKIADIHLKKSATMIQNILQKSINLFSKFAITIIAIFFIINIIYAGFYYIKYPRFEIIYSFLIIALLVILLLYSVKSKWLISINEKTFVLVIAVLTIVLGIISILFVNNRLILDPADYHNATVKILSGEMKLDLGNLLERRTIFYTLPFYYCISSSLIYLKFFNLILTLLTSVGFYYLLRLNNLPINISRISCLIFSIIPLRYLNINIPSHDIAGIFYLILFCISITFLLKNIESKKGPQSLLYFLLSVVLLFILELQRSLGIFIMIALFITALFFIYQKKNKFRLILISTLISVIIAYFTLLSAVMKMSDQHKSNSTTPGVAAMIFSFNKLGSFGRYIDGEELFYHYLKEVPENSKIFEIASGQYIGQLTDHPIESIKLYIKKSIGLLSFRAAFMIEPKDRKTEMFRDALDYFNQSFRIFLYSFFLIGLFSLFTNINSVCNSIVFLFIYLFVVTGSFILTSEVSPNYTFLIFPSLSIIVAYGISDIKGFILTSKGKMVQIVKFTPIFIGLCLFIFLLLKATSYLLPYKTLSFDKEKIETNHINIEKTFPISENYYSLLLKMQKNDSNVLIFKDGFKSYANLHFFIKFQKNQAFNLAINHEKIFENAPNASSDSIKGYQFIQYNNLKRQNTINMQFYFNDTVKDYPKIITLSYLQVHK